MKRIARSLFSKRSAAAWRAWARNGWRPDSSTACSTPTTSTSPAKASITARGASCPSTIPASPPPISTRPGSMPSAASPTRCCGTCIRLAECLLPLAPQSSLEQALATFEPALHREFPAAILRRLGLQSKGFEQDGVLAKALWTFLHESKAPFEQTFFDWYGGGLSAHRAEKSPSANFYAQSSFEPVHTALGAFTPSPRIRLDHPYFARSHPAPC